MSTLYVFENNASSQLASTIVDSDTSVTVLSGQGVLFPAMTTSAPAKITLEDTSGNIEVVLGTGLSGDVITVIRGQEGTTPLGFNSGSRIEMRVTAGMLAAFFQKNGGDTITGTTTFAGILEMGSSGSIQGGEVVSPLRGVSGQTSNQVTVPSSGPATSGGSPVLTTGNIAANMPVGYAMIVTGMVVIWTGSSSAVPAGFHVCDGTNGTPDLQDLFVIGAGGALPTSGNVTGTTETNGATGLTLSAITLTTAEMPVHQHPFDYANANSNAVIGDPGFSLPASYLFAGSGAGTRVAYAGSKAGGSSGTTSPFTPTVASTGSHDHAFVATSPSYVAKFYIMKL